MRKCYIHVYNGILIDYLTFKLDRPFPCQDEKDTIDEEAIISIRNFFFKLEIWMYSVLLDQCGFCVNAKIVHIRSIGNIFTIIASVHGHFKFIQCHVGIMIQ